ncbi:MULTISPECIES: ABC transporter ATP-binding protein [unclassified Pseudoxanthomonas]|uniref:ABC transporter ATP-binding protein n=1 Tax=unclassified Pseudoxanthomonas TaxID=2645906 RepID=UPI0008E0A566|nr:MULTISPECIES: ABC transporter ATP-binding protein [unclassified Pseudoxanthomonas]PPJ41536.1 ABC transporter ATP-binding protein [Pseudoxanthomonas sp. KAs_5_3]SFV29994.1 lipopolysaccharide transport system ATP-binding protein [Pseudoxanthomonas sp. YR558]
MSATFSLLVEDVGKAYVEYASELQRFARWFGLPAKPLHEHWVLQHISFRVGQGEAVGIVGQNGAGKSTLLKIITGTTLPSTGRVGINGRVSALLELGLGFSPELTGRENARHALGLMGLTSAQIADLIGGVESFAEIGEYFDQPIRTYSSGMQMRVAFSVATAVRPDVLIVDEALSVGDAYFVHKCFRRIREYREAGTTLLIVSHDASAIQSLCDRAVLIDRGRMVLDGYPREVLDYYNALIAERENSMVTVREVKDGVSTRSGTGEAGFTEVALRKVDGSPADYFSVGERAILEARVAVHEDIDRLVFGYMIRDRLGQPVYGTNTHHSEQACKDLPAGRRVTFSAEFPMNLGPGTYSISMALSSTETHLVKNYQWWDLAQVFTVANTDKPQFVGCAWIPPVLSVVQQDADATVTVHTRAAKTEADAGR